MEPFPEQQARDALRQVVQAAIDVAPAGGAVNRLADLLVAPRLTKRREDWFRRLGEGLAEHLRRVEDIEAAVDRMQDSDVLVTSILIATEIAGRTHQESKLEALRNACLHVVSALDVDEQYTLIFLQLIDELSPLHLKVLTYLADPTGYFEMHGLQRQHYVSASRRQALNDALPDLAADEQMTNLILRDLEARGLSKGALGGMVTENAVYEPMASDLGLEFLGFISPPW